MDGETNITKEQITPEFYIEKINNGAIVAYNLSSLKEDVIDVWANMAADIMQNWPEDTPCLAIYDWMGAKSVVTTPHVRLRAKELATIRPELVTYTAVVIPQSFFAHVTRMFVEKLPAQRDANRQRRIFFDRQEAEKWLMSFLKNE